MNFSAGGTWTESFYASDGFYLPGIVYWAVEDGNTGQFSNWVTQVVT